jgi:protein O-GlcNAc transferase
MTRRADPRRAKTAGASAGQANPAKQRASAAKANLAVLERAFELHRAGRLREAEPLYQAVIQREPGRTIALLNFSILLRSMGRLEEALALAGRAIAVDPKDAMAHFTLGATLRLMRRDKQASAAYEKALEIDPAMIRAWVNLAVASERIDRNRSVAALERALTGEPNNLVALNMKLKYTLQECDFEGSARVAAKIVDLAVKNVDEIRDRRILANIVYRALFVAIPRPLQRVLTDRIDALHLLARAAIDELPRLPAADASSAKRRLRIGYMTPNLSDHPVGHVTVRLFPAHDRARFEIHAFVTQGRRGGDPTYNARHRQGVDFYHDLGGIAPLEAARRIRNLGIDILVDLDGYMEMAGTAIMTFRPAPVQLYWLGHAGGLGLSFVDYLIADRIVVPPGEEAQYREAILRLPECYHVASPAPIAASAASRAACGLPDGAFVFGAFNNPEKIDRAAFAAWMRILAALPGSVLWLSSIRDVPAQIESLRRKAAAAGIDPARLVFAERLLHKAEHLARHRHIDLFLDTLTLNASTTALDALWAGVPILAVRGERFANRISNTMLAAIGLPDMIVDDLDAYVARAIHLAGHREELDAIALRLRQNRERMPLFDIDRFARHLEAGYESIWARYCRGEMACSIDLPAQRQTGTRIIDGKPETMNLAGAVQLHIGATEAKEGWRRIGSEPGASIDDACDPRNLGAFGDDSVDAIYATWYYQQLGFRDELPAALAAAARVLKPGGTLRLAVPDFEALCGLMVNPAVPKAERFSLMAIVFGDQSAPDRQNRAGLTADILGSFLKRAGFRKARRVVSFGLFDDVSNAKRFGQAISLNIEATK